MKDPNHLVFASLFYLFIGNGEIFIEETLQHTMTTKRRNLGIQVLYYTSNTKRKSAKVQGEDLSTLCFAKASTKLFPDLTA